MSSRPLLTRVPRSTIKTITFDGTTYGAVGALTIGTVTGRINIEKMSVYCSTLLAGATATIELGTANNTAALIAQTTATDVDATEFWKDATPEAEVSDAITNKLVGANIILTVGTAAVSSGVLEFSFLWLPMSSTGNLA